MSRKLAIKRLTVSDLTFFASHYRRGAEGGNQKAINLNRNVFIDQLYPSLPEIAMQSKGRIPLDLFLYGPGLSSEYNLQRKIVKHGSYKNWRLDGELVYDPPGQRGRFSVLSPGDFVVLQFFGDVKPESAKAVLVGQNVEEDRSLWNAIDNYCGQNSMLSVTPNDLLEMIREAGVPAKHPIYEVTLDISVSAELEDAAMGGSRGVETLLTGPVAIKVTADTLQRAKRKAEEIGVWGEEIVRNYLESLKKQKTIRDFEWESARNAVSPFDFRIIDADGSEFFVDVKATEGEFHRRIHISLNELRQVAAGPKFYIYRLYYVSDNSAKLRMARFPRRLAENVLRCIQAFPDGVSADSFSLAPELLDFGEEMDLSVYTDAG